MRQKHIVEVSRKTIVFSILFLIGLYLLFLLRDIILGLFIAVLVATALNPAVTRLEKLKIPRSLAIITIYALVMVALILLAGTIIPPLIAQSIFLLESLPIKDITSEIQLLEVNLENLELIKNQLGSFSPLFKILSSTFSGLVTLFTFAVVTYYILLERNDLHKYLTVLFKSHPDENRAEKFVNKIERVIGGWIRGELALMFIVGLITYLGLRLLNVPYALALAIIAGFLEVIPNIGPTISAIPAILIPLFTGENPIMSLFVAALYILVQQLENNVIVPRIMQQAVGVHPLVTIILIIVGLQLLGITGAILAIPGYLVAQVVYKEFFKPKKQSK